MSKFSDKFKLVAKFHQVKYEDNQEGWRSIAVRIVSTCQLPNDDNEQFTCVKATKKLLEEDCDSTDSCSTIVKNGVWQMCQSLRYKRSCSGLSNEWLMSQTMMWGLIGAGVGLFVGIFICVVLYFLVLKRKKDKKKEKKEEKGMKGTKKKVKSIDKQFMTY